MINGEKHIMFYSITKFCYSIILICICVQLTRFVNCVSIIKLWTCFSARVSSILRVITATSNAVEPAPYMFSAKIIVIIVFLLVWHFLLVFETSKTNLWSSTNAEMALFYNKTRQWVTRKLERTSLVQKRETRQ